MASIRQSGGGWKPSPAPIRNRTASSVSRLPDNAPVNVVREDPERKGLLFAGTERAVFVSFNDGDDWQPLRLNMPATSIRDLVIHGDDVVVSRWEKVPNLLKAMMMAHRSAAQ